MSLLFFAMDPGWSLLEATGGMAAVGLVFGGTLRPLNLSDRSHDGRDRLSLAGAVALLPVDPRRLAAEAMVVQLGCGLLAVAVSAWLGSSTLEPFAMLAATLITSSLMAGAFLGHQDTLVSLATAVLTTLTLFVTQAVLKTPEWPVLIPGLALFALSLTRLRASERPS